MIDALNMLVQEQLTRIENHPDKGLLSEQALSRFSGALRSIAETVSQSTVMQWIVQEAADENPFAALDPGLLTNEQRSRAEKNLNEKMSRGEPTLPEPLTEVVSLRLKYMTDGLTEMLERMNRHRDEICAQLLNGRTFKRIEDMAYSAGDTHNSGRNVAVLRTDTGMLVYKPHDMRVEADIYALVQQFFSDVLVIPGCIAFGDRFGVSEFIEKRRPEGGENARLFWRSVGGAAAVIKLLGSTDMHVENLSCTDNKLYILDLETVISPVRKNKLHQKPDPGLWKPGYTSPCRSGLLPMRFGDRELSVLVNTHTDGCAPAVNGRPEPVFRYMPEFLAGYEDIYRRILAYKEKILRFADSFSPDSRVRILLRNTRQYNEMMRRLYHRNALASREALHNTHSLLIRYMQKNAGSDLPETADSEVRQMERGDCPLFYTCADSLDLYADGTVVAKDVFMYSAKQHILKTLDAMSEKDLAFDLSLFTRSLAQYPVKLEKGEQEQQIRPIRKDAVLTPDQALAEAKKLFDLTFDLRLEAPDGRLLWGYFSEKDAAFRFCEAGLANGLTGIALFMSAYAYVSGNDQMKALADKATQEAVAGIEGIYDRLEKLGFPQEQMKNTGETEGLGGILTGLALMKRYTDRNDVAELQRKILDVFSRFDLYRYDAADRMGGMAGLLAALCRFDEYKAHTELIRSTADRLLALKNLKYRGKILWKSIRGKDRPISGGGHGHAGIAEALFAAAGILGEDRYAQAAKEAIRFELEAYSSKFHTWSDLRTYPPAGYMNGYCSGAPGIGIMLERIRAAGFWSDELQQCAELAEGSMDSLPLNETDFLCCGNSAVAEYYMSVQRFDEAGKVLAAMRDRSEQTGGYRFLGYDCRNAVTPSLFYGTSGIGYEMLRYSCPDKVLSVL